MRMGMQQVGIIGIHQNYLGLCPQSCNDPEQCGKGKTLRDRP